jgi:hypothetical protein
MNERVTIFRFTHKSDYKLLGDGTSLQVLGWSEAESLNGLDLDELEQETNAIGRISYIFHSGSDVPVNALENITEFIGFEPENIEMESFEKTEVLKENSNPAIFDREDGKHNLVADIFVLFPNNPETIQIFRQYSRDLLFC